MSLDAIPGVTLTRLDEHGDERGRFVEIVRAPVLSERDSSNPELRWDDIPPFT